MNTERLRKVVTALRDADRDVLLPEFFTMEYFGFNKDPDFYTDAIEGAWAWEDVDVEHILEAVDMWNNEHGCGTPACAIGHYAVREDLQDDWVLTYGGDVRRKSDNCSVTFPQIAYYFDISEREVQELFGPDGCKKAKTPGDAADYIEQFINDHESEIQEVLPE